MSLLDNLSPESRERMHRASSLVQLEPGEWLIRRGDAGGDLYLVEHGALEVVDTAANGRSVLALLKAGDVVGELSFLDAAPRSADVRARTLVRVRRWSAADIRALLAADAQLAAQLVGELAATVSARLRKTNREAITLSSETLSDDLNDRQVALAALTRSTKAALHQWEDAQRRGTGAEPEEIGALLSQVQAALPPLFDGGMPDAEGAARAFTREIEPWLRRSRIVDHCLSARQGGFVTPELLDHLATGAARGSDALGMAVDAWWQQRPTLEALREADEVTHRELARHLGSGGAPSILVMDTPSRHRVVGLQPILMAANGALTLVDESVGVLQRSAEATVGAQVSQIAESPLRLATGRARPDLAPQDAVLLHHLLCYLPDRLAYLALAYAAGVVGMGGTIWLTVLADAPDAGVLQRTLGWTFVRRAPGRLERLLARLDLVVQARWPAGGCAEVWRVGTTAQ